jgi:hypothetical protein
VIEATKEQVMFGFNQFSKIEIHSLSSEEMPMNINFDKQICNIRSNCFEPSIFLVLVNDMFVLFDNKNMNAYKMIEYPSYKFHDINWSYNDKNLIIICGEFRKEEQITVSGFLKIKKFRSFQQLINDQE